MKRAGRMTFPNDSFFVAIEFMRYMTDIISRNQKARIVLEYDPGAEKCHAEIFIPQDAPYPLDIR